MDRNYVKQHCMKKKLFLSTAMGIYLGRANMLLLNQLLTVTQVY